MTLKNQKVVPYLMYNHGKGQNIEKPLTGNNLVTWNFPVVSTQKDESTEQNYERSPIVPQKRMEIDGLPQHSCQINKVIIISFNSKRNTTSLKPNKSNRS